jgi:hypothetical protein
MPNDVLRSWLRYDVEAQLQIGLTAVIGVVCSDRREHRRRVEQREPDLPGFIVPAWERVSRWEYEPWQGERLVAATVQPHSTRVDQVLRFLA